jgi:hypothetical protein
LAQRIALRVMDSHITDYIKIIVSFLFSAVAPAIFARSHFSSTVTHWTQVSFWQVVGTFQAGYK